MRNTTAQNSKAIKANVRNILSESKVPLSDEEIIKKGKDIYTKLEYVNAIYELEISAQIASKIVNGELKYVLVKRK